MTPTNTEFLIFSEVTKLLGKGFTTVRQLPIPHYRLPGHVLYSRADVEAFKNNEPSQLPILTNSDKTLSRDELAGWIRVAPMTIKHWSHRRGDAPEFKRGTSRFNPPQYPLKTVQAWLMSCRVDPVAAEAA